MTDNLQQQKVVIVGAGFSGICMGVKLKECGIDSFIILEKADSLGGTWRENTYPGAECDIPSALYSYAFEHNHKRAYKWSGQQQILEYQNDTAAKYGIDKHVHYGLELASANYDESEGLWHLEAENGQKLTCRHLITAVGQLHHPAIPEFKNQQSFKGDCFHSAQWNHHIDLKDKRVAVIGNAASAVQFIPEIASQVAQLTVFQRSANWMIPKADRPYSRFEQWLSMKVPPITKLYRFSLWLKGELGLLPAIRGNRLARWLLSRWSQSVLKKSIIDPDLIAKLTPDYPLGAKRVLFSDAYYPALARENVTLVTDQIVGLYDNGIETENEADAGGLGSSVKTEFDVIIYGTGFKTNPFLAPMHITGVKGKSIRDAWQNGAQAYLGVTTANFPNFYMLYGPNTNLGHNSIIIMIEAQAKYIRECIRGVDSKGLKSIVVKDQVEAEYNQILQQRLASTAFSDVRHSWYMDGGKITNNWAGGTREYMRLLRSVDWADFSLSEADTLADRSSLNSTSTL